MAHTSCQVSFTTFCSLNMEKLRFIHIVRPPEYFSSGRSRCQSYISSNFTIASACALQAFICRTHSIWFSAFSFSVTPFRFASSGTISSMRFRAASSISAQYCLTHTQLLGAIQSVEKVAVRHFFENYGVCLSHELPGGKPRKV